MKNRSIVLGVIFAVFSLVALCLAIVEENPIFFIYACFELGAAGKCADKVLTLSRKHKKQRNHIRRLRGI